MRSCKAQACHPQTALSRRRPQRSIPRNIAGRRGAAVKVCMFHLMPYRDLPGGFRAALQLGLYRSGLVRRRRFRQGRPVLQRDPGRDALCREGRPARALHQPASPERLWLHGESRASWARCWRSRPTARTSRSSSSARRCRPPRRRRASPRNTRCSTASAAGGWWPASPPGCRPTPRSRTASSRSSSASASARRWRWSPRPGRRRRSSPGTASTISSAWSISGRGRSSSRIRRSGSPAPASPRPPNMSSGWIIASAI